MKTKNFALALLGFLSVSMHGMAAPANEIIVAQVAPLTGVQGATGNAVNAGAQLYFDFINSTGGIDGRQIVFIKHDDEYKPEQTVQGVQQLIEKSKPVLFTNTIGTATTEALVKSQVLKKGGVSLLGPATGAKSVTDAENVFPIRVSYDDESLILVKHLALARPKRLAVLYQNDGYGKDVLASIQTHIKQYPETELVLAEPYDTRNASLAEAAANVAKAKPDVVIMAAVTKPAVAFIREFRKMSNSTLAAMSPVDPDILTKQLKPEEYFGTLVGAAYPHPSNNREPIVAEMHKVQKTLGRTEATSPRYMEGFITAKTAVMAMRRATKPITSESMTKALAGIRNEILGGTITVNYLGGKRGINYVDVGMIGKKQFLQ